MRSLSHKFLIEAANKREYGSVPPQNAGEQDSTPASDTSVLRQVTPQYPPSLDRRLDERIDEKIDGREEPARKEGTLKSVTYAQRIQEVFFPDHFLADHQRERFNLHVWGFMTDRGIQETEKFISFVSEWIPRKRRNGSIIPKLSVEILKDMIASWDRSDEKSNWDKQIAKLTVPDWIGQPEGQPRF